MALNRVERWGAVWAIRSSMVVKYLSAPKCAHEGRLWPCRGGFEVTRWNKRPSVENLPSHMLDKASLTCGCGAPHVVFPLLRHVHASGVRDASQHDERARSPKGNAPVRPGPQAEPLWFRRFAVLLGG